LALGDTGERGTEARGDPVAPVGLGRLVLHGLPLLLGLGAEEGADPARALLGLVVRPGL
jgi:hypothetical protein